MRRPLKWLLIALVVAVPAAAFIMRQWKRQRARSDADCRALATALQEKQASRERDKIRIYYEFKATEMADDEAWRKAVQEVESEIAALSNAVAACRARR